jgi:hypothetical protein
MLATSCTGLAHGPQVAPAGEAVAPVAFTRPAPAPDTAPGAPLKFETTGYTELGDWWSSVTVSPSTWKPGDRLEITATLRITDNHTSALYDKERILTDGIALLVTAERTFDSQGRLRLSSDERMSTLVTPTGLAIEGGVQGAVTDRYGYGFRTPVDEYATQPFNLSNKELGGRVVTFKLTPKLPDNLPAGIYRLRFDYGFTAAKRLVNLNCEGFSKRPFFKGRPTESHLYTPPIRASGLGPDGKAVDAAKIVPRVPWVVLFNYSSNGYRGVVAAEDKPFFALSDRNIIPDEVILPLYDDRRNVLTYSLEPAFPTDTIEERSNIPWDYKSGELSIKVTGPDGRTVDLGSSPFVEKKGQWPTTKKTAFTGWKPSGYGLYTVKATGWLADAWGNRYEGGGTYHFWIAKRMTMATATFQGQPYATGGRYGRDIGFAPAVPAEVTVNAVLYVNSDPANARKVSYSGKATPYGIFGAAQGMKPLPLDAPGEYHAHILATYLDPNQDLWVCSMRHAGVVYPEDTPIVARGKKLNLKGQYVERGNTYFEGHPEPVGDAHLSHVNYPYAAGDVLLIASEGVGANKIEPVLNWELKVNPAPWDPRLRGLDGVGSSNLQFKTSNNYSPHLFPEYITEWNYYYAGAPRPGFMSRFLVGEDGTRAPYWPTSPNSFGGQINASPNGDVPGDIYRLLGGVVMRKAGQTPLYAGYMASAFILPKGSNNNRIVAAGTEDVPGADGSWSRFFLVGLRPGMTYEQGTAFAPAVQIDPMLPVNIRFQLTWPDGRTAVWEGQGDKTGTFVGANRPSLDLPGVYTYTLEGEWQGYKGYMPGLPKRGGYMYVVEKERPAGAPELKLNLAPQSYFVPDKGVTITGASTASFVHYAAVIPGAVIDQGVLPVRNGKFEYRFDPAAIHEATPTYDIISIRDGKPDIKDVVHLTFFSGELGTGGQVGHSYARVILRGNQVLYTR